ncbi:DNA-binding protein [Pseudomonas aeruginosa]|uniref:DNA-binding protein n=1 Tax=Pseudomonas aeruginosa TaxID=287 RepID=UPI0035BC07B9
MKDLSLHQAAQRLGLSRPELIKRMKAAGLLDSSNLPAAPVRDRLYLRAKETSWHHPELGMQYSHSTKVRPYRSGMAGRQARHPRVCAPAAPDRREVG